jgi:CARDB
MEENPMHDLSALRAGRALAGLALVATLLPWAPVPPPARAEHGPGHDPDARLEIVVKRILIHDDYDWGEGDISITVILWEGPSELARSGDIKFGADDGETVTLHRVFPWAGDRVADPSIGPGIGIPVYADRTYGLQILGFERDDFTADDALGFVYREINLGNNWGPLGTYTERADNWGAAFSVEYEMRRAGLPDLRPTDIRVHADTGDVCLVATNPGPQASGPFRMRLYLDGALAPGGDVGPTALATGETNGVCTAIPLPTTGQHRLALVVDEERAVPESDESNNRREEAYPSPFARPGLQDRPVLVSDDPAITPDPAPGCDPIEGTGCPAGPARPVVPAGPLPVLVDTAAPDLRVGAVEVRHADGGRCVIRGRNTVAATIRNAGGTEADPFAVELAVGGQRRDRASVGALAGGAERRVEIHNVPFFEGERSARVVADPDNTVKEGDEANNARDVELDCVAR